MEGKYEENGGEESRQWRENIKKNQERRKVREIIKYGMKNE